MIPLRYATLLVALVCTAVPAAAQRTFPQTGAEPHGALPGPNATPPDADQHSPDAGTTMQPVPGAWPDTDTVPSTMSEKNAADDKLNTVAYTFKNLTAEERSTIFNGVKNGTSPQRLTAELGTELPYSTELRPLPDEVVAKVPRTKGYAYVVTDNKVLLVQAPTRFVVAVIEPPAPTTTGAQPR